jgi:hypothetical protein
VTLPPKTIAIAAAGVIIVAVVAFLLLRQPGSPPTAPPTLGSYALLVMKKLPGRLATVQKKLVEQGVSHPLVALYAAPGSSIANLRTAFLLSGGKTRTGMADFRGGLAREVVAIGGLMKRFDETIGAAEFSCGTIRVARKEETTCIWQDSHAVISGVGYDISPAETLKLTAVAQALLQLG